MAGRSRNRASGTTAGVLRPAGPAGGNPYMPPGPYAVAGGAAPRPVPASAAARPIDAIGAVPVQICGTDNDPTRAARPDPAETAAGMPAPPKSAKPAEPNVGIAEPSTPARGGVTAAAAAEEDMLIS
jgi:hypothetical protein